MLAAFAALLVSFILPFAIYFYLRNAHKEDEEYKKDCRKLLLKGLLLGFPVFGFSLLCSIIFSLTHVSDVSPYIEPLFENFVLAGFSEELMKYLLARKIIRKNRATVSFLDVMAYTTISAIGFELMEAVVYFFTTNIPQILVRGLTSMHATFGLAMGFFLARRIRRDGKIRMFPAVLITTLVHGLYDLLLEPQVLETGWGGLALFLAFACMVLNLYNFRFMNKARKKEYYTEPLFPDAGDPEDGTGEKVPVPDASADVIT